MRTLLYIFFLLLLSTALGACEQREGTPAAVEETDPSERPTQESWDVRYTVSQVLRGEEASRPRLHVEAGYMAVFENDSTYTLLQHDRDSQAEQTVAFLFDEAGDSTATVTANQFYYYTDDRRMEADGDVRVQSAEERLLETEFLVWDEEAQRLQAPGFVRLRTPTEQVEGYELEGDETLQTYEISRVTGQVTLKDDLQDPDGTGDTETIEDTE
jgi:LPS export ABC transporter protein LptC